MNLTRRQFTSLGALAAGAALLPSCARVDDDRKTIAVLFDGLYTPFWVASFEAIRADVDSRGYRMVEAISNQDDSRQLEQVRSMIARGVDGIIIVHSDANAVIPAIRAANRAGLPMVHFNRAPATSDAWSVAVQADNVKITRETVEHMVQVARERGGRHRAAVLMGDLGDGNAIARRDGFLAAVEPHPDVVEIVARVPTNWDADTAFAGLTNALQSNPDINFLFTSSDFMFPQIVQALRSAGKYHPIGHPEHVILGGFDGDQIAYEMLQDKYLDADGVQDLYLEARLAVDAIEDMLEGRLVRDEGEQGPRIVPDPGFVIHQDNLVEVRDRMWGYELWKQEQAAGATA